MDDYRRREEPFSLPPRRERHGSLPSRKERYGSRSARSNKRRLFTKKWFFLVIITSLLLIIGGCSTVVFTAGTVDLKKIENLEYASVIYDQEGKLIGRIGVNRERITIEELKKHNPDLIQAFVKVEDARFYKHNGVDYFALMRAVVKNIIKMGAAEGGGTITMQVARNAILRDHDKNIKRKAEGNRRGFERGAQIQQGSNP